jgi:AMMECR1 domain-containing protein
MMKTLLLIAALLSADAFTVFKQHADDARLQAAIVALVRQTLTRTVAQGHEAQTVQPRLATLRRHVGVFVTLVKPDGTVRGCMGSLSGTEPDAANEIVRSTELAATQDFRYKPLRPSELPGITAVVSIIGPRRRVTRAGDLDPMRLGLLLQGQGRSGVLLPGEAAAPAWQIEACRQKAELPKDAMTTMYVFPTVTFRCPYTPGARKELNHSQT